MRAQSVWILLVGKKEMRQLIDKISLYNVIREIIQANQLVLISVFHSQASERTNKQTTTFSLKINAVYTHIHRRAPDDYFGGDILKSRQHED